MFGAFSPVEIIALVALCALSPIILVLVISYTPDMVEWIRGGPNPWRKRDPQEQLQIDFLRAKGRSRRSVIRTVETVKTVKRGFADIDDMLNNPDRRDEALAVARKMQEEFDNGSMPPQLREKWSKAMVENLGD